MSTNTSLAGGLGQWIEERLGLSTLMALGEKKKVPVHNQAVWYYMGGIALVFLLTQVVTGILLMVYYIPELGSAHSTILKINSQVEFGWFIRSLHSWGANLMILSLFFHMFSSYFMKAYRKPRELTWVTGIALLALTLGFGFTGYLLPWDEVSFFATKIGLDIAGKMPIIGDLMATVLRGGPDIGQATLSRFFMIHVGVLPVTLLGLLGAHFFLIQAHGMSEPDRFKTLPDGQKEYEKFFPTFALKDMMVWLLVLNLLAVLVTLAPWGVGPEADPFGAAPLGIKPEWYFLAMFQFLKFIPPMIGPLEGEMCGILFFGLIGLVLATVPFWDRGDCAAKSKLATLFGVLLLMGFVAFTLWGFAS